MGKVTGLIVLACAAFVIYAALTYQNGDDTTAARVVLVVAILSIARNARGRTHDHRR